MFALHPHQQVYFNALVDTKTPGALAMRYNMDYWHVAQRQALEYLIARYPDDALRVWMRNANWRILTKNEGERIQRLDSLYAADFYLWTPHGFNLCATNPQEADFYQPLHPAIDPRNIAEQPPIYSVKAYGSAIAFILPKDVAAYRAAYHDVAANGDLLARADFDIYAYDGALYYLSADCPPPATNLAAPRLFLHIFPADLPANRREFGFESLPILLNKQTAFFDGKCIHRQILPHYPIARIRTGQETAPGVAEWRADINLVARAAAQAAYHGILAGDYGAPIAQSRFDLYLRDNALTYLKEPCAEGDAEARFFLHIFPADPADLPADGRKYGFANLDYQFTDHGARIDDKCVAARDLPDYPIARVRTGQIAAASGGENGAPTLTWRRMRCM